MALKFRRVEGRVFVQNYRNSVVVLLYRSDYLRVVRDDSFAQQKTQRQLLVVARRPHSDGQVLGFQARPISNAYFQRFLHRKYIVLLLTQMSRKTGNFDRLGRRDHEWYEIYRLISGIGN